MTSGPKVKLVRLSWYYTNCFKLLHLQAPKLDSYVNHTHTNFHPDGFTFGHAFRLHTDFYLTNEYGSVVLSVLKTFPNPVFRKGVLQMFPLLNYLCDWRNRDIMSLG